MNRLLLHTQLAISGGKTFSKALSSFTLHKQSVASMIWQFGPVPRKPLHTLSVMPFFTCNSHSICFIVSEYHSTAGYVPFHTNFRGYVHY